MMALGLRANDHHHHQQQDGQKAHKRLLATQLAASHVRPSGGPTDKPCIMRSVVPDRLAAAEEGVGMRIAVYGAGGVGGYFPGPARPGRHRGPSHRPWRSPAAVREHGLRVEWTCRLWAAPVLRTSAATGTPSQSWWVYQPLVQSRVAQARVVAGELFERELALAAGVGDDQPRGRGDLGRHVVDPARGRHRRRVERTGLISRSNSWPLRRALISTGRGHRHDGRCRRIDRVIPPDSPQRAAATGSVRDLTKGLKEGLRPHVCQPVNVTCWHQAARVSAGRPAHISPHTAANATVVTRGAGVRRQAARRRIAVLPCPTRSSGVRVT